MGRMTAARAEDPYDRLLWRAQWVVQEFYERMTKEQFVKLPEGAFMALQALRSEVKREG